MDAGAYGKLIKIQKLSTTHDEIGNPEEKWMEWKEAYAYVNGLSGSEYWEAAATHQQDTVEFIFRWHPFFNKMDTRNFRLIFEGKIFDIYLIDNLKYKNQTVKIRGMAKDE